MTTSSPDGALDFLDPGTFAAGIPHDAYRRLRDEAPASWQTSPGDPGFWLLTRHRDVQEALVDAAAYSSWRGGTTLNEAGEALEISRNILLNMDPPGHTRYRKLITRAFASRAVERMGAQLRALCQEILDGVTPRGECDFIADVASVLPMHVILELVGVPRPQRMHLLTLSNTMIEHAGTDIALSAAMEMYQCAADLTALRRAQPAEDLMSYLISAEVDGEKLTDPELNAFFLLLVVAGNETTRTLISGGLLALMEHPAELARLRADPSMIPSAVEEMLRFVSPILQFRRTANRDITLHGQTIREGDKVIVAHASANFDERVFPDPLRFDLKRSPNPHVAFGFGPHLCLGAALARLETRVMFEELLPRMENIELVGPPVRVRSTLVAGIQSMPIRFSSPAR